MKSLISRMIKQRMAVQLALTLVFATAVVLFGIYNSFILRETVGLVGRMPHEAPEGYLLVTGSLIRHNEPLRVEHADLVTLIAGWHSSVTPSNLGRLPVIYLDFSHGTLASSLDEGVVAVHRDVALRLGLSLGDEILLFQDDLPASVRVTDIYDVTPFELGVYFGEGIVAHTGTSQQNDAFLYRPTPEASAPQVRAALAVIHGRGSTVRPLDHAIPLGSVLVRSNYVGITQAKYGLAAFLALAFLTSKYLNYLGWRRILAMLQAIGLRKKHVAVMMAGEALLAPLAGAIIGGGLTLYLFKYVSSIGYSLPFTAMTLVYSIAAILPAVVLGVFVVVRLAHASTVQELLQERRVPLLRARMDRPKQHYPAMDGLVARGVHLLYLRLSEGVFDGFVLRNLGDRVRAGEVVAVEHSWWGLKETEYVAPIDGHIVYFEKTTGMIGISARPLG